MILPVPVEPPPSAPNLGAVAQSERTKNLGVPRIERPPVTAPEEGDAERRQKVEAGPDAGCICDSCVFTW